MTPALTQLLITCFLIKVASANESNTTSPNLELEKQSRKQQHRLRREKRQQAKDQPLREENQTTIPEMRASHIEQKVEDKTEKEPPVEAIVGGDEIVPRSRPYLLTIGDDESSIGFFCGASLISSRAILTAAQCVTYEDGSIWPFDFVEFNRHEMGDNTGVTRMYIKDTSENGDNIVVHPEWDYSTFVYDFAVVFLPNSMSDITPVKLNEDPNIPEKSGDPLEVAGWGSSFNGTGPFYGVPQNTTLGYVPNDECNSPPYQPEFGNVTSSNLCAHAVNRSGCFGDGGGPLVIAKESGGPADDPPVQVGVSSYVGGPNSDKDGCYSPVYIDVYARVSEAVDWIKETVCARTGELCPESSKSGKGKKAKAGKAPK